MNEATQEPKSSKYLILVLFSLISLVVGTTITIAIRTISHENAVHSEALEQQVVPDAPSTVAVSDVLNPENSSEIEAQKPHHAIVAQANTSSIETISTETVPISSQLPQKTEIIDFKRVDDFILDGQISTALALLTDYDSISTEQTKVQIKLRLGWCSELLGNPDQALAEYYQLIQSNAHGAVAEAATLASIRVLMSRSQFRQASKMLMRLLISNESQMEKQVRGSCLHLLGEALMRDNLINLQDAMLILPEVWLTPVQTPSSEEILWSISHLRQNTRENTSDDMNVRSLTGTPEGVFVSIHTNDRNVKQTLHELALRLNWSLNFSPTTHRALKDRTAIVQCHELPLENVLDALLGPLELQWSFKNDQLSIEEIEHSEPTQLTKAERSLRLAISLAPEHKSTAVSYLLIGTLEARKHNLEEAIQNWKTAAHLFPRTSVMSALEFNLGKALLEIGQSDNALKSFYATVDRSAGPAIDAVAYLYIGRILLENDKPRDAIMPLSRGLVLAEGSPLEAQSTLLLSAAHLMSGNPISANKVLTEHHHAFKISDDVLTETSESSRALKVLKNQASFQAHLAKVWSSNERYLLREASDLVESLTNIQLDQMYGKHTHYLAAVAFGKVGLRNEQISILEHSLKNDPPFPLQERFRIILAGSEEDEFRRVRVENTNVHGTSAAQHMSLVQAQREFREGRHSEAFQICQKLLSEKADKEQAKETLKQTLQLMGQIYQLQGQHEQAVNCFMGIIPKLSSVEDSKQTLDLSDFSEREIN